MNEPNNRVDGSPNDSLTDLQVNPEQAEEARAGTLGSGGGGRAGKVHVADFSVITSIR